MIRYQAERAGVLSLCEAVRDFAELPLVGCKRINSSQLPDILGGESYLPAMTGKAWRRAGWGEGGQPASRRFRLACGPPGRPAGQLACRDERAKAKDS